MAATMFTMRSCHKSACGPGLAKYEVRALEKLTGPKSSAQPTSANPSHLGSPFSSCRTISSLSPSLALSRPPTSGSGVPPMSTSTSGEAGRSATLASVGCDEPWGVGSTFMAEGAGALNDAFWAGAAVWAWAVGAGDAAARSCWSFLAWTFCAEEEGADVGGGGRTGRCFHSFSRIP